MHSPHPNALPTPRYPHHTAPHRKAYPHLEALFTPRLYTPQRHPRPKAIHTPKAISAPMLSSHSMRSPQGSPPQGSHLLRASNPRSHPSSARDSLTPALSAPNPQTTHNHETPTVRSIQPAAHDTILLYALTHGRRGSSGKTGQSRAAAEMHASCCASTHPPVMHPMRRCSLQVAAASWMELDELILERGVVALCAHATWRVQFGEGDELGFCGDEGGFGDGGDCGSSEGGVDCID